MPDQIAQSRVVRRRNPRPINSCIECRQRKSRCSKTHPCQNCTAFGRDCVFISVPETHRKRAKESGSKSQVDWTQPLPLRNQNENTNGTTNATTTTPGTPPRDYEWEAYQQDVDLDDDVWGKLPADPQTAHDGDFEDEDEDEDPDWVAKDVNLQIGRMVLTDRNGGLFRPQYAEELGKLLSDRPKPSLSSASQRVSESSALLSAQKIPLVSPSLTLLFGSPTQGAQSTNADITQLPTRQEAEVLYQRYLESVNPVTHVLHIPSFKRLFDSYWVNIDIGSPNPDSSTALVLSVCMVAAASLSPLQSKAKFGIPQEDLCQKLQTATENALVRANWTRTSNIRTLQALTIYLIPQCRAHISRTTSVLVGALIRLAQCIGIHRASHSPTTSLSPLQRHIRSLLWHQICFLDVRTAEVQGPQPSIRSDEFDVPLPLNVDDDVFELASTKWQPRPISIQGWTDATFSLIRYECNELHRLIFRGRVEMDHKITTLHDLRSRVETRKRQIHATYLRFLDPQVPIQRCAGLVATLLLARCDSMLLYRHLPQNPQHVRSESENRLRDILLTAALTTLETGATLETLPSLNCWAWYASTYQQYSTVLLLLTELYRTPDLPRKDRMVTIIDHIFGHCYGVGVQERCGDLLWAVKENLETFYGMRGVRKRMNRLTHGPPHQAVQDNNHFTPDNTLSRMSLQSQTQLDGLDVDLDTLLEGLNTAPSSAGMDGFLGAVPSTDTAAIFMPADSGVEDDWMAGVSDRSQMPPLRQWDTWRFPPSTQPPSGLM
ncbi:hypothetical protein K432DRAFT_94554 [Lepidopterella palustris CBS 459.81]|uniref:Zn(2)-C6 fungal-type domain-containing protein n=1 Tax=Lepidopterella palustris CBS 459.81 TaxID=1314670 RepID=A0A8E2EJS0_9PEZI|nr:hypothetical protein K432DRAFT_94554 [Lepidopterella palustris CBS 459.81]